MKYKDIIRQMERNGDYSEADEFRDELRNHGHSEYERADRDPRDGAGHSHVGDRAFKAAQDIRRREEDAE